MKEKISFQVKTGVKDLFTFLMYYNYKSFGGVMGLVISGVSLAMLAVTFPNNSFRSNLLLLFLGLLFTVIQPLMLLQKAASQKVKNPNFNEPLQYELGPEEIVLRQKEQEMTITWDTIVKVVESKQQILVFTSRVHAFVWPKEQLGEDSEQIRQWVSEHVDQKICRWKKKKEAAA